MSTFEEERDAYLKKILSLDVCLVDKIFDRYASEEKFKEASVVLTPSSERQLRYAEAVFTLSSDIVLAIGSFRNNKLNRIPLEQNEGLQEVIRVLKELKEDRKIDYFEFTCASVVNRARLVYACCTNDLEKDFETIIAEAGFDKNNMYDVMRAYLFIKRIEVFVKNHQINNGHSDYYSCNEREEEALSVFAQEFHRLFEKECSKNMSLDDLLTYLNEETIANEVGKKK